MRGTATRGLLKIRMDDVSMIQDACLQTHVNLVNLNREYRKEHTLPIRRDKYEGVVAPCVAHFFSGYTAKERERGRERNIGEGTGNKAATPCLTSFRTTCRTPMRRALPVQTKKVLFY